MHLLIKREQRKLVYYAERKKDMPSVKKVGMKSNIKNDTVYIFAIKSELFL